MSLLNPHDALRKKNEAALQKKRETERKKKLTDKRKNKALKTVGNKWTKEVLASLEDAYTREEPVEEGDSDEEEDDE
jgi:hypothetical protein